MDAPQDYPLIGECTDRYEAQELPDGAWKIEIIVPRRFRDLVLEKLLELRVSRDEYFSCMPHHRDPKDPDRGD